jgi:hypothetical protein
MWEFSLIVALSFVVSVVILMLWAHRRLHVGGVELPQKIYTMPSPGVHSIDEPVPDIPKPVYGSLRATSDASNSEWISLH